MPLRIFIPKVSELWLGIIDVDNDGGYWKLAPEDANWLMLLDGLKHLKMSHSLALSNLSLASSCYKSLSEEDQRKVKEYKAEREARSLAVEKAYVHDVYEQISGRAERLPPSPL